MGNVNGRGSVVVGSVVAGSVVGGSVVAGAVAAGTVALVVGTVVDATELAVCGEGEVVAAELQPTAIRPVTRTVIAARVWDDIGAFVRIVWVVMSGTLSASCRQAGDSGAPGLQFADKGTVAWLVGGLAGAVDVL